MSGRFIPVRQIKHDLSRGRTVTVQTDGTRFGLIFFNGEEESRALLTPDAMAAVVNSYTPLAAGRGEPIVYKWKLMVEDDSVQREEPVE